MSTNVRYIVESTEDVRAYEALGFEVLGRPGPGFAVLGKGDTRLFLNVPGGGGGAGQTVDGRTPRPGGWNRIQVQVESLDEALERLAAQGVRLRGGVVEGRGGRQVIAEDASGNPIEVFEPATTT